MGQLNDHFQQARDNRRLALALIDETPNDHCRTTWAMTVAFYAAVHCIEGHFTRSGEHSKNHGQRDSRMLESQHGIPKPVLDAYDRLQGWSEHGRYDL